MELPKEAIREMNHDLLAEYEDADRTADDAARYRPPEEVQTHWKEEPIGRLRAYLVAQKVWGKAEEEKLAAECQARVEAAIERYLATPPRAPETMFDHLYAALPKTYVSQRDETKGAPHG